MGKKWLVIAILAVIIVLVAVPAVLVLSMHNSRYDLSFSYVKCDNLMNEIAKRHVYYSAADKTVEIELNQDLINSVIKDNIGSLDPGLPKNVAIREVMFNTRNRRLYINAVYGKLNVPVSAKINVKVTPEGVEFTADDIEFVETNAPGFIKKQISPDLLKYSIRYEDFDIPQIFSIAEIKFGSGTATVILKLDEDLTAEYAADYYSKNLAGEVDTFRNSQTGIIGTFINKILGSGVLSDGKIREYVSQALDNEELMNCAVAFAAAGDLGKYTEKLQEVQKKVEDWAAPLQVVQYYGSIDGTVDKILKDQKLRELLAWFLPQEEINEYVGTVEEYYAMYKDYYGLYEDAKASLDKAIGGIDTKKLDEYVKLVLEYAVQAKDTRKYLIEQVETIDAERIEKLVLYLENDKSTGRDFIGSLDPDGYDAVREYLIDAGGTKAQTLEYLQELDLSLVDEFSGVLENRKDFAIDIIKKLKREQYEQAFSRISGEGIIDRRTKVFADKVRKEADKASKGFTTSTK